MIGKKIADNLIEKYNPNSILFCPYKEEMWDSMDTIYSSIDCNKDGKKIIKQVMPIAYYTLRQGKVYDIKIEFPEYAGNFPTALKNGLSEKYGGTKKWDVIVFHYPYDNLNNVTRPLIMSQVLKEFCYNLVLVYYACRGDKDIVAQDIWYSGVKNSDLVIFETEKQAEQANKIMREDPYWHGECVGWGTAKMDWIEMAEIPEEWKKKAEGKRVVLLQTSLVPYLKNKNKIAQVESYITSYINNPKVCLIWRPHPLLKDTIIAHQRHDLFKFESLKEMVMKSPKDILDETPKPETCIKFADEMISDSSSLVIMWKTTGKKLTLVE